MDERSATLRWHVRHPPLKCSERVKWPHRADIALCDSSAVRIPDSDYCVLSGCVTTTIWASGGDSSGWTQACKGPGAGQDATYPSND
ncbi:hypothetical protein PLICRDRAFT_698281 [Plicaturopsis crispa FD-325 SS-3]|nr:hypothetical protein PLICRDRAFT_698281 [Plicaturopsis crispa FD-325 SS-3]